MSGGGRKRQREPSFKDLIQQLPSAFLRDVETLTIEEIVRGMSLWMCESHAGVQAQACAALRSLALNDANSVKVAALVGI